MSENQSRGMLLLLGAAVFVVMILVERPGYFTSTSTLGTLIIAEAVLAAVAKFRKIFLLVLLSSFLWAGIDVPFRSAFFQGRWYVLGIGAVAGVAVYMRGRSHFFNSFHLVALFCVVAAFVSGSVSAYPDEALLKALSLLMLFVYSCTGARAAVPAFEPGRFFKRLLLACEVITYITAILYFAFRWEIFGNPNSLGAVVGVALIPTLLWGYIGAQSNTERWRLGGALILATLLVMSSFARAGIGAAGLSLVLVCVALRQYRLLIKGLAFSAVIAVLVILLVPRETDSPDLRSSEPITSAFIYKGKQEQGLFGSRRGIWKQTWDAIEAHPWFGSGFGTSATDEDLTRLDYATHHVDSWVVREHGNSYLAIVEWTGLLGVLPFLTLVGLAILNIVKVLAWLRRTGDVFSPAVPAAAIVAAGLFHAMFEDWMFAVGYYLSVFFWAMAFILVDVMPRATVVPPGEAVFPIPSQAYGVAVAGD